MQAVEIAKSYIFLCASHNYYCGNDSTAQIFGLRAGCGF